MNPGHLTWAQSQSESFNEDSPQGGPAAGKQCSQNNSEQTKWIRGGGVKGKEEGQGPLGVGGREVARFLG